MKNLILSLIVITLTACGWHLRGSTGGNDKLAMTAPLNLVIITEDDHTPLMDALRQALPSYKVTEVSDETPGALTLSLAPELMDRRTAGVGSDALTSAYEIILTVEYSLSNTEGMLTPLNTKVSLSRTYDYNVNNANSATQEEELVLQEMRRELANTILRRTKSLALKTPSPLPPATPQ